MSHPPLLPWAGLALVAWLPASGQSVVSTHSGLVYYFAGSVSIDGQQLEQKFARFPEIGDGHELRTVSGRAEVILTPGVVLRVDERSAIRMLSTKLSDTRVELLDGSAILEADEAAPSTSVTLFYKNWKLRIPEKGVCRIDARAEQVRVYKGEADVSTKDEGEGVSVAEGQSLPLAAVLVPEKSTDTGSDSFKNWAMDRSSMVSSDNATAQGIVDDASLINDPNAALGGLSYFPITGIPSMGMTSAYGTGFWTPFESGVDPMYLSPYLNGFPYLSGFPYSGWPVGVRIPSVQPRQIYTAPHSAFGSRSGTITPYTPYTPPRAPYTPSSRIPHSTMPRGGATHSAGHR